MPNETVQELVQNKGISNFGEIAFKVRLSRIGLQKSIQFKNFQEDFIVDNIIKTLLDTTFFLVGWVILWFITRALNSDNRTLFVKKRSVSNAANLTRSLPLLPENLEENAIKVGYETIIKKLESFSVS